MAHHLGASLDAATWLTFDSKQRLAAYCGCIVAPSILTASACACVLDAKAQGPADKASSGTAGYFAATFVVLCSHEQGDEPYLAVVAAGGRSTQSLMWCAPFRAVRLLAYPMAPHVLSSVSSAPTAIATTTTTSTASSLSTHATALGIMVTRSDAPFVQYLLCRNMLPRAVDVTLAIARSRLIGLTNAGGAASLLPSAVTGAPAVSGSPCLLVVGVPVAGHAASAATSTGDPNGGGRGDRRSSVLLDGSAAQPRSSHNDPAPSTSAPSLQRHQSASGASELRKGGAHHPLGNLAAFRLFCVGYTRRWLLAHIQAHVAPAPSGVADGVYAAVSELSHSLFELLFATEDWTVNAAIRVLDVDATFARAAGDDAGGGPKLPRSPIDFSVFPSSGSAGMLGPALWRDAAAMTWSAVIGLDDSRSAASAQRGGGALPQPKAVTRARRLLVTSKHICLLKEVVAPASSTALLGCDVVEWQRWCLTDVTALVLDDANARDIAVILNARPHGTDTGGGVLFNEDALRGGGGSNEEEGALCDSPLPSIYFSLRLPSAVALRVRHALVAAVLAAKSHRDVTLLSGDVSKGPSGWGSCGGRPSGGDVLLALQRVAILATPAIVPRHNIDISASGTMAAVPWWAAAGSLFSPSVESRGSSSAPFGASNGCRDDSSSLTNVPYVMVVVWHVFMLETERLMEALDRFLYRPVAAAFVASAAGRGNVNGWLRLADRGLVRMVERQAAADVGRSLRLFWDALGRSATLLGTSAAPSGAAESSSAKIGASSSSASTADDSAAASWWDAASAMAAAAIDQRHRDEIAERLLRGFDSAFAGRFPAAAARWSMVDLCLEHLAANDDPDEVGSRSGAVTSQSPSEVVVTALGSFAFVTLAAAVRGAIDAAAAGADGGAPATGQISGLSWSPFAVLIDRALLDLSAETTSKTASPSGRSTTPLRSPVSVSPPTRGGANSPGRTAAATATGTTTSPLSFALLMTRVIDGLPERLVRLVGSGPQTHHGHVHGDNSSTAASCAMLPGGGVLQRAFFTAAAVAAAVLTRLLDDVSVGMASPRSPALGSVLATDRVGAALDGLVLRQVVGDAVASFTVSDVVALQHRLVARVTEQRAADPLAASSSALSLPAIGRNAVKERASFASRGGIAPATWRVPADLSLSASSGSCFQLAVPDASVLRRLMHVLGPMMAPLMATVWVMRVEDEVQAVAAAPARSHAATQTQPMTALPDVTAAVLMPSFDVARPAGGAHSQASNDGGGAAWSNPRSVPPLIVATFDAASLRSAPGGDHVGPGGTSMLDTVVRSLARNPTTERPMSSSPDRSRRHDLVASLRGHHGDASISKDSEAVPPMVGSRDLRESYEEHITELRRQYAELSHHCAALKTEQWGQRIDAAIRDVGRDEDVARVHVTFEEKTMRHGLLFQLAQGLLLANADSEVYESRP
mgnify:FL=1